MSLSTLNYTKDWTSAEDFPTVQTDENQVRADQQFLFNEIKDYLNDTLIPGIESAIAVACQDLVVGQLTDGSVTKSKLSAALIDVISRAELGGDLDARINAESAKKVSKSGDTMTGDLGIVKASFPTISLNDTTNRSYGSFQNNNHITELGAKSSNVSGADYRSMRIYDNLSVSDLKEAFKLVDRTDGAVRSYDILHTGNLENLRVARISIGSYVGTGTYGANNPNSLTFDFVPKAVFMIGTKDSDGVHNAYMFGYDTGGNGLSQHTAMYYDLLTTNYVENVGFGMPYGGSNKQYGKRSDDGKTFSWYADYSSSYQFNNAGTTFYYMALY